MVFIEEVVVVTTTNTNTNTSFSNNKYYNYTYIGRGVLVGWLVGVQRAAAIKVQILESLLSSS